jgi:hypothetical protein
MVNHLALAPQIREGGPECLELMTRLRADLRATGLPDAHPLAEFFDRCVVIQEQMANMIAQREALITHLKDIGKVASLVETHPLHNVGLPDVADQGTANLLLAPEFEVQMVAALRGLLTPSEVESAVQRLHTTQAHLRQLASEGRLLTDGQWRMDHVDAQGQTVGELLSDARHNHIARLDWKFEEWQAKQAAEESLADRRGRL